MNRQSGENRKVSQNAKPLSLAFLKNPKSLKSPIARNRNSAAMVKVARRKNRRGIVAPNRPRFPKIVSIAANNAAATSSVVKIDG